MRHNRKEERTNLIGILRLLILAAGFILFAVFPAEAKKTSRVFVNADGGYSALLEFTAVPSKGGKMSVCDIKESSLAYRGSGNEVLWERTNVFPDLNMNRCISSDGTRILIAAFNTARCEFTGIGVVNEKGGQVWGSTRFGAVSDMKLTPNGMYACFSTKEAAVFVDVNSGQVHEYKYRKNEERGSPNITSGGKGMVMLIKRKKIGGIEIKSIDKVVYEFSFAR